VIDERDDRGELYTQMFEQVAVWCTTPEVGQERIVRLACDLLLGGDDGPEMAALAGLSVRGHDYAFADRVEAALREVNIPSPDEAPRSPNSGRYVRRVVDARRSHTPTRASQMGAPGHWTRWAREAQTLVELDDAYDTAEYVSGAATVEDTDARVHAEAKQLLNRS
jgi:hypothetical protein